MSYELTIEPLGQTIEVEEGQSILDAALRARLAADNEALAAQALRVLAVGGRLIPAGRFNPAGDLLPWVQGITLHALVGIIDPPRAEAREAIARVAARPDLSNDVREVVTRALAE